MLSSPKRIQSSWLRITYNGIKQMIKTRHPYDTELLEKIEDAFVELEEYVTVVSKQREENNG